MIWGCHTTVLVYGYATGVFSSRKLERATYDSVAFCFIAAPLMNVSATPDMRSVFIDISRFGVDGRDSQEHGWLLPVLGVSEDGRQRPGDLPLDQYLATTGAGALQLK
jgi:hypothetical protein